MSMKPNYFKIGVFVITAIILILAAVIVFGSRLFNQKKVYFETYFNSSVSGLNVGAPVELMGVRMGQVERITFAQGEYEMEVGSDDFFNYGNYVLILASLDEDKLPVDLTSEERITSINHLITRGFRLRLASNILTGQAYLQGEFLDPYRYPVLEVPWEPKHFYISSAPGELTTMKQSVDNILHQLEQIDMTKISDLTGRVLISLEKAVDDANIPQISRDIRSLIADTDKAVEDVNMPAVGARMQELLKEVRDTNMQLQILLRRPENTDSQMANIAVVIANINRILLRMDKFVMSQSPNIEQVLQDLKDLILDLKDVIEVLKQQPSQLILSEPPPVSEVSK